MRKLLRLTALSVGLWALAYAAFSVGVYAATDGSRGWLCLQLASSCSLITTGG